MMLGYQASDSETSYDFVFQVFIARQPWSCQGKTVVIVDIVAPVCHSVSLLKGKELCLL